jgi:hypothetical protein
MKNSCKKWLAGFATLALLLLSLAATATAQEPTGSVEGTITDPQGAVVVKSTVTVRNLSTGFERTAETGDDGRYHIANLPPGTYEVRAAGANFKTTVIKDVKVNVGQNTPLDVKLEIGGATEEVNITASGEAQIDRVDNTVSGVVGTVQIENLPLNGRNFLDLAQLQPGTEKVDGASFDPTKANYTGVSIAGQAGRSTQITVDGGSVVDNIVGTTTQNFSQEIVQEFQMGISNYDLSTGASASGSVNIISRSGTNDYHGNAYIYARDAKWAAFPGLSRLDAANGLPTNAQADRIPFNRRQFGGTVGGPIKKDKAFFFFNVERNNQNGATVRNPVDLGQFAGFTPAPFRETLFTAKTDFVINSKNNLFVRYSFDDNHGQNPFPAGTGIVPRSGSALFSSNDQVVKNRTHGIVAGLTSSLSSNLTNDFRYNYNHFDDIIDPASPATGALGELRVWNGGDQTFKSGTNYIAPQTTFQRRNQIRDDITWARGSNTIRFGGDFEHTSIFGRFAFAKPSRVRIFGPDDPSGPAQLLTEADFLNAPVRDFSLGVGNDTLPFADPSGRTINNRFQFYGTDSWKATQRFTLNFGLAYRYDTNLYNLDLARPTIIAPLFDKGTATVPNDKNNLAPRVGFAWDVAGNGRTVVRGGFGMYYDTTIDNLRLFERADLGRPGSEQFLTGSAIVSALLPGGNGSFSAVQFVIDPVTHLPVPNPTGYITLGQLLPLLPQVRSQLEASVAGCTLPTGVECTGSVSGPLFQQNFQIPYSLQYSIGIQRELPWKMLLQTDYNFRKGVHEVFTYDANFADSATGPRLAGFANSVPVAQSGAFSTYSGLLTRVDRRFSKGFQFTASYTLSRFKAFGGDTLGLGATTTDLNNFRKEFGPSGLDRTHRLVVSGLYELPWFRKSDSWAKRNVLGNWGVSLISTAFSGVPRNAFIPNGANLSGTTSLIGSYLPGTGPGDIGRKIKSVSQFNAVISAYNSSIPTLGVACPLIASATGRCDVFGTALETIPLLGPNDQIGGDSLISQDLRVTKKLRFSERLSLDLIGEVFNLFNVANLTGFRTEDVGPGNLTPTDRQTSIFGTGGPRSFQFAAKFRF